MPRRPLLTSLEKEALITLPDNTHDLIKHYTFNEQDVAVIKQRRGNPNRLGFAVNLCYLRYPGIVLGIDATPPLPLLEIVARQLEIDPNEWNNYAKRGQTRRAHFIQPRKIQASRSIPGFRKRDPCQSASILPYR